VREEPATTERGSTQDWGIYSDAIRRWEGILAVPAPDPTVTGARGGRVLSPYLAEWMIGVPGRVTGVPSLTRNEQLKLIGNGVVPQQAERAIRCLLAILQEGPV
jgi:DNA (cytosine-5)-methyltransferase 1